ncbi:MAG: phosphotransferase [Pirellulales bacterium]|nr:phosphotransferase [Pirellulales bacterium]
MLLDHQSRTRSRWRRSTLTPESSRRRLSRGAGPFDFHWHDPAFAALVGAERLDELASLLERTDGVLVARGRPGRETLRVVLGGDSALRRVLFLKRETSTHTKDLLRHVLAGRGYWTKCRAEFEVLRALREAGINVPRPIACVQQGLWRPQACLVVEGLDGTVPLAEYLSSDAVTTSSARRGEFFSALAREVARLHATGYNQPDLFANHVHVATTGASWQVAFLDFQRSTYHANPSLARRARDLAALWATLPRRLASERDEERFLDSYLSAAQLEDRAAELLAATRRRVERLLRRRKIWEIRESDTAAHRSVQALAPIERGRMWIDPEFRPHLEHEGRATFADMMATTAGECLRALADRENWRLVLDDGEHAPRGAFLKKHHIRTWNTRFRAKLGLDPGDTAGRVEARNIARLARGGIAAMRLIAYGEGLHADGLLESFVLTEELVGCTQLDHFLRRRFPALNDGAALAVDRITGERHGLRNAALDTLLGEVASVARHFHAMGYNHRDFYCCHFFIREHVPGEFRVHLIDLQRVQHRTRLRRRWIVKDLAQLAYSAPRERISRAHKMAFIKQYLGVRKLRPQDKQLIRRVLRKQRWMEWTLGLHP